MTARTARYLLGGLGLLLIAVGIRQVIALPDPLDVAIWLGGGLVLHDGIIAPLVLGVGLLLAAGARAAGWSAAARGLVRGALLTGGVLVMVTLPLLLRPGAPPNPSALPLPYGRNLLLVLGAVLALTLVAGATLAAGRRARSRTRNGNGNGDATPQD
ncbi:hypothetical protein OHS33_30760 [Streptomyces sp. NBC_00536]|uniref:hypothetical protein n=1 Tax=Streptomyces sp. NBC_00536 TaxID=2975769 RepID=UPI002E80F924|nr:hypothetical protein [Streptomyces sp. NBC_00536]WUC82348.1 hypothetical protein OHS33_30760 [Streptomyces sp. NBC_00536]